jgi:hypothetical protein
MGRAGEGTLGRVLTCRDGREAGRQRKRKPPARQETGWVVASCSSEKVLDGLRICEIRR